MANKILTVDDSKTIRMIVKRAFKSFACQILEAADGMEGLTVARQEKPDVILLDLTMPVMDGVEMLTRLKADPELRMIPVIMLTAESGRENVVRIAKLGVRDYLIKPFKEELVVERVGRIIDLKRQNEVAAAIKRFDDPLNILVVDDKPAIIDFVRANLGVPTWKVHGLAQASEVTDFCSQTPVDVILVSLSLKDGAAFNLFQRFRAGVLTRGIRILALSIKTATEEQSQAQQTGFDGIVTKPIDCEELKVKIARTLNLDTSYRYFQRKDDMSLLVVPADFNRSVADDILFHLRPKLAEAVDAGSRRFIVDMSKPPAVDLMLIKLGISVLQLCTELGLRTAFIGSEAVAAECKNYEESKDWQLYASLEEVVSGAKAPAPAPAA